MNIPFLPRLGTFFILVGCGLLVLFTGSVFAREFNLLYLLFAAASLLLGFSFRRVLPPPEPTRFSAIRRLSQRSSQRRIDKQTERDNKK